MWSEEGIVKISGQAAGGHEESNAAKSSLLQVSLVFLHWPCSACTQNLIWTPSVHASCNSISRLLSTAYFLRWCIFHKQNADNTWNMTAGPASDKQTLTVMFFLVCALSRTIWKIVRTNIYILLSLFHKSMQSQKAFETHHWMCYYHNVLLHWDKTWPEALTDSVLTVVFSVLNKCVELYSFLAGFGKNYFHWTKEIQAEDSKAYLENEWLSFNCLTGRYAWK